MTAVSKPMMEREKASRRRRARAKSRRRSGDRGDSDAGVGAADSICESVSLCMCKACFSRTTLEAFASAAELRRLVVMV
jgi:hypothetical protein